MKKFGKFEKKKFRFRKKRFRLRYRYQYFRTKFGADTEFRSDTTFAFIQGKGCQEIATLGYFQRGGGFKKPENMLT